MLRKADSYTSDPAGFDRLSPGGPEASGPFLTLLDVLYILTAVLLAPWWLVMLAVRPSFRAGFFQRFGFLGDAAPSRRSVWLHGSSAGEVDLLKPLVHELEANHPGLDIVISAFAISGYTAARKAFGRHRVVYAPVDLSPVLRRFVRLFNPVLVVLVESEFWPNLIAHLHRAGTPVSVVNGKMSQKSFRFHRRTRLVPRALRKVDVFAVQADEHANRLRELGVAGDAIRVTGNMKYDLADAGDVATRRRELRERYGFAGDRPVLLGGSVHEGEYEALAAAFSRLLGEGYALRLILVPRYVAEAQQVLRALSEAGLEGVLKTGLDDAAAMPDDPRRVLVVDTMGELKAFYALSDVAYVGGSLHYRGSNRGGHNLMEPAILGVVPMFGPHNYSFRETVRDLREAGAGLLVHNVDEICENLRRLLDEPGSAATLGQRARQVILTNRGATSQVYALLSHFLTPSRDEAGRWSPPANNPLHRESQQS